ncbi:GntR family transcriptional regulator [soil metagenome]
MIRTAQQEEKAFQLLRKAILTGDFIEGDSVREARLAREWKIGRTPLRQAVRRAAAFGYITLRPNYAPIVRKLSAEDVEQIYSLREELECAALKAAWDRIKPHDIKEAKKLLHSVESSVSISDRLKRQFLLDEGLHAIWISNCNNAWLVEALERLLIYRPNQISVLRSYPHLAESGYEDHKKIIRSLEEGDLRKTTQQLRLHIRRSGGGLVQFIRSR